MIWKDLKNFRAQRAALGELENLKREREELYYKIERNKRQIEVNYYIYIVNMIL